MGGFSHGLFFWLIAILANYMKRRVASSLAFRSAKLYLIEIYKGLFNIDDLESQCFDVLLVNQECLIALSRHLRMPQRRASPADRTTATPQPIPSHHNSPNTLQATRNPQL